MLTEREARGARPWSPGACRTPRSPAQLFVSPATAKTHVSRLLTKLDARDRAQLVVVAYETGLVTAQVDPAAPGVTCLCDVRTPGRPVVRQTRPTPDDREDQRYQQRPPSLCADAVFLVRGHTMSVARQLSVLGLMLALAGIDFAAALVAQDFADRRRGVVLLAGCLLQVTLFLVYALALRLASLSIVTMGWIVLLQVALFATDLARGRLHPGAAQWVAVVVVLVAQAYLVATTTTSAATTSTSAVVLPYEIPWPAGDPDLQTSTVDLSPGRSPVTR